MKLNDLRTTFSSLTNDFIYRVILENWLNSKFVILKLLFATLLKMSFTLLLIFSFNTLFVEFCALLFIIILSLKISTEILNIFKKNRILNIIVVRKS